MLNIVTILGTRPEVIRLSRIIPKLDVLTRHTLIHTSQNFVPELDSLIFECLRLRTPDCYLDCRAATPFAQVGKMFAAVEEQLHRLKPDACLMLGDVYSGLSSIVAEGLGIPVFHMEAGNRCHDYRVPEEHNRKIIDHVSTWQLPYVPNSRANLLREGIDKESICVCGNPIYEVLTHYAADIDGSAILGELHIVPKKYFLVTAHRAENVDNPRRLQQIVAAMNGVAEAYQVPVVWSCHPRTTSKLEGQSFAMHPLIMRRAPFNVLDFVKLEKEALCVISDSGTVQEECCIFHVPSIHIRDATERPETVECGSNILTGIDPERVLAGVRAALETAFDWTPPPEYLDPHVSDKVVRFLLGNAKRRPPSRLSLLCHLPGS